MRKAAEARQAFSFLTAVVPPKGEINAGAMTYFPLVGAVLGAGEGAAWRLARRRWSPLTAAALTVAGDLTLTGALHFDGLADSADGLLAHVPERARLDIMAEPQVGTFGTVAVGLALVARVAALSELEPEPLLLAALGCGSRSLMVLATRALPYARRQGLGSSFEPSPDEPDPALRSAFAGLAGAAGAMVAVSGKRGLFAFASAGAAAGALLALASKRLGGYTGDVLGATGVVFETVGLIAAAKK